MRAVVLRAAPVAAGFFAALDARAFVPDDFARVVVDLRAVALRAVVLRFPVERERPELFAVAASPLVAASSSVHLPDMTR